MSGSASAAVSRLDSKARLAGASRSIASMTQWLSPPTVNTPGAWARVSNSMVDPERGAETMNTGRSNWTSPPAALGRAWTAGALSKDATGPAAPIFAPIEKLLRTGRAGAGAGGGVFCGGAGAGPAA